VPVGGESISSSQQFLVACKILLFRKKLSYLKIFFKDFIILRGTFLFWSKNHQKNFNSTIQFKNSIILQRFATGKFRV
jgi:hypothetical protein